MITAIVVLYKMKPEESKTYQNLLKYTQQYPEVIENVVIYDNSPTRCEEVSLPEGYSYVHDSTNDGLAKAYNCAFEVAKKAQSKWLWLFDQDTDLENTFLDLAIQEAQSESKEKIASIVPYIRSNNKIVSPVFADTIRPLVGELPKIGLQSKKVMAINSGSLVRIDFLEKINGFNLEFPIDYLDHWFYHRIFEEGYTVDVINCTIDHELSLMTPKDISDERYLQVLTYEKKYYKNYNQELFPAYKKHLKKRYLKNLLVDRKKAKLIAKMMK
ncbi:glycosyltransferase [Carnobacterium divergens]|uniref:Glycosyltransferase 2-like domain-containing protein n=1 Tax=Carnobacterium divergens TaxID=2748 RepID=A0A7Z8G6Z4_CARDV|nr:glycosyltransferase [Carnobacterium divergens]TFI76475.1 hypothetical protein CKN58_00255 [Carnobacterium divergens]TFI80020.1 hypothetical protein CKN85_00255 [Carnobacterium divergens]TFI86298.1 hypothetical protein CKN56_00255 [Carnobacterium divergens]TFI99032.1 hypothetical protein CKN64_00255 [Carnobacterium divergens]TFJ15097.1 hypothetical protein CKN60_00250 [Carnobacterium divergens]